MPKRMTDFLFSINWNIDMQLKKEFALQPLDRFSKISVRYGEAIFIDNPADSYTTGLASMVQLALNDSSRAQLIDSTQLNACEITDIHLVTGYCGFLTIEVFGKIHDPQFFHDDTIAMANILPERRMLILQFLDTLKPYLSSRNDFSFGQPILLQRLRLCDPSDSYVYTTHIFSSNPDSISELRALYHIADRPLSFSNLNHQQHCEINVWQRFGKHLWLLPQTPDVTTMHSLSFANIVAVWEVLIYDTGAINYKNFLRLIIDKQEFDHSIMRATVNRDNLRLQEVGIAKRELSTEQSDFTMQSREQFSSASRKALFDKGQEMLRYAIDGVDTSKQSKSNKTVEIILSVLTAMSVYSVVNDGFTLVTNKEEEISFHFMSSFLFTIATAIMLIILFIVIRKRE